MKMQLGSTEITFRAALDFRSMPFNERPHDIDLENAVKLAFRPRFHWYDQSGERSTQIYLEAEYSGAETIVEVPKVKYQPGRNLVPQNLPVFEIGVSCSDMPAQHVGCAAIAYLFEGQTPGIFGLDGEMLGEVLGAPSKNYEIPRLGLIATKSLHSIRRTS